MSHRTPFALTALALALVGCASPPGTDGPAPASATEKATEKAKLLVQNLVNKISPETPLQVFERQHRQAAKAAAAQGRWAEAQWEWDVVLALKPDDAEARSLQAQAQGQAASAAAAGVARARQAQQKGEVEVATKAYLEALAATPTDTATADALRELERNRGRRGNAQAGRAMAAMAPAAPAPKRGAATTKTGGEVDSNDLEHASMLAAQGDMEGAMALLKPLSVGPRADANARAMLAELYVQQSDRLLVKDRAGAIRALEACLQLQPGHRAAAAKLKALKLAAAAPVASSPASAPATPSRR